MFHTYKYFTAFQSTLIKSNLVKVGLLITTFISLTMTGCGSSDSSQSGDETSSKQIQICVSSTDAKVIAETIGGDLVAVTGFVPGNEDPHVVEPTRSMIQALSQADLLIVVGLGLEQAWLPAMIETAKNDNIKEDTKGYLDLSEGLRTLVGQESRGVTGSFHPEDNPHYLLDPVEAVRAASLIRDRLSELKPEHKVAIDSRYLAFFKQVSTELLGEQVAQQLADKSYQTLSEICIQIEHGNLPENLGGQLADAQAYAGTLVVGDHDLWPYFARRYGVQILGYLEPEPGLPPTVPHLTKLIEKMKQQNCTTLLTVPYFDPKQIEFFIKQANVQTIRMANLPESHDDTETYLKWMQYNANALKSALGNE